MPNGYISALKLTIRKKLFVSFVLVLTVSIVLSTYLNYRTTNDNVKKQQLDNLTLVAETKEGHLFEFLERLRGRAVDFASDGYIRDGTMSLLRGDVTFNSRDLNLHLRKNKMSLDKSISGINIFSLEGQIIASTGNSELGRIEKSEDYFVNAKLLDYGQTYLSDVSMSDHFDINDPIFSVSAPLMSRDTHDRLGVLVIYIKTDELNDLMTGKRQLELGAISGEIGRGQTLDTYLVNKSGYMISTSRFDNQTILKQKVNSYPVLSCETRKEGASSYINYRGSVVMGSWMCLNNGWTLIAEVDNKESLAVLGQIKLDGLITAIFLLLFALAFSLYISRRFSEPIKQLSSVAKKIGDGDLAQKIVLSGSDEISLLGESINTMALKLKQLYENQRRDTLEIAHEQAQDEAILKSIGDGLVVVDKDQNIMMVNTTFEQMFGFKSNNVIGKKIYEIVVEEDEKGVPIEPKDRLYYKSLTQKQQFSTRSISQAFYYKRRNGSRFPAYAVSTPIKLGEDNIGVVEVFRDITNEKITDKAKSEFVSLTSHQLRTPLAKIRWYLELLFKSNLDLARQEKSYLTGINKANNYMIELVNILLNVSRLEMGTLKVEKKPMVIEKLVEEVLSELSPAINHKKIKVIKEYDVDSPNANLDPKLSKIVLNNVIGNAVKYSVDSGVVKISITHMSGKIKIEVSDNGCGIPKDDQPRIFTKHFRAENASAITSEGSGLGLYIVKLILVEMGGRVSFLSPIDGTQGTKFEIQIPTKNR